MDDRAAREARARRWTKRQLLVQWSNADRLVHALTRALARERERRRNKQ